MANKMPFLAVAIFSVAMLSSNANAGWLDIIKGIAGGVVGVPQQNLQQQIQTAPAAKNAPPAARTASATPPTEEEILVAVDSLTALCSSFSEQGLICAKGDGFGETLGTAQAMARGDAIANLGSSLESFTEQKEDRIRNVTKDGKGKPIERQEYNRISNVVSKAQVKGAQEYFSYSYKNDGAYYCVKVMVLNPALFEKAMNAKTKGGTLDNIFEESVNGVAKSITDWYNKK